MIYRTIGRYFLPFFYPSPIQLGLQKVSPFSSQTFFAPAMRCLSQEKIFRLGNLGYVDLKLFLFPEVLWLGYGFHLSSTFMSLSENQPSSLVTFTVFRWMMIFSISSRKAAFMGEIKTKAMMNMHHQTYIVTCNLCGEEKGSAWVVVPAFDQLTCWRVSAIRSFASVPRSHSCLTQSGTARSVLRLFSVTIRRILALAAKQSFSLQAGRGPKVGDEGSTKFPETKVHTIL